MTSQVLAEKKKLKRWPLELRYLGDRVLRQSAKRVAKVDGEMRQLVRGRDAANDGKRCIGLQSGG